MPRWPATKILRFVHVGLNAENRRLGAGVVEGRRRKVPPLPLGWGGLRQVYRLCGWQKGGSAASPLLRFPLIRVFYVVIVGLEACELDQLSRLAAV